MTKIRTDEKATERKKAWIRPRAETTPASSAQVQGGGTGDGVSCHS
ncbi:MAG TPA: hypothetical protein VF552_06810 [Allosphingosinicella sp.]|jgi:hypothetical protein